ncbi:TOMM precursor leader peptide-binding protein [Fictibacillus phosphorivorans]|uniref:TOMM precursor leader peptide-binding protein n=1 Tax=Fictibacillus phosphorivorans TaxID=1221500 RepID=UPI00203AC83C|nr:TOMM precursor leader peptide-binding protein [Fictibacillus phosphorivorans]MCM3718156.1 TOMM precursor leader peptide-binding protein [Fictibacillus phosphorivorans]MCM3775783.1 TOMM precursor leader peptide-binding protein [Fictibacillus phosphorivorans]
MKHSIAIIGDGKLADYVSMNLGGTYSITRCPSVKEAHPNHESLALFLHDSWDPIEHVKAEEMLRSSDIPWLRAFFSFGEAIIGPLVLPDEPGCSQCADSRLFMTATDRRELFQIKEHTMNETNPSPDPWGTNFAISQTSLLIEDEVHRFFNEEKPQTARHIQLMHLQSFRLSRHFFLPDPYCSVCSELPEDTADSAKITLKSSPKTSPESYRCRSIDELQKVLSKDYLDGRTGILNFKRYDYLSPFADTVVNLPLLSGNELNAGRTQSYAHSEISGILEGLERYCGYAPRGKQTTVYEPYSKVEKYALNPESIGLHTKEQYERPHFPFKPLDPDRPVHWVWGYSLTEERPILVPETFAYYSLGGGEGFVYETSNGCAVGGSLEEAILYGIFEVVERDAFLMAWYGQLPIPRLDAKTIDDAELQLMLYRLQHTTGYIIELFNATTENGIPSIWALAKNTKDDGLNLLCAAGAHLDPSRAIKGAVQELSGMLLNMDDVFKKEQKKFEEMLHDSYRVRHMEDHSMLYGLKEAEKRMFFLLDKRMKRSFTDEFQPVRQTVDLMDDLQEVLDRFKSLNMDVIVVDQTGPELKRNGLHCVKVVIPGMLPMTFGHHLTRLKGLDRVLTVPAKLGYVKQPLTFDELNPYPHPFP